MSLFYLVPPRVQLGDSLADLLHEFFPGLDWSAHDRIQLANLIASLILARGDVYVVHREDIPHGETVAQTLTHAYGAEPGDEVVEIRPTGKGGEMSSRRWRMAG